jgi:hypothetical protein
MTLTAERLRELVVYHPDTGVFNWRHRRKWISEKRFRAPLGSNSHGYLIAKIDGVMCRLHIFAWLYMTGQWPKDEIDHKDRDKTNNRWTNLREATKGQNRANQTARSKCGVKGVTIMAHIKIAGKVVCLGYFASVEEAGEAYRVAAEKAYGEFHCT